MSFWKSIWEQRANAWILHKFPSNEASKMVPGEVYLNVWLRSARLVNSRIGLNKFYGAIQSRMVIGSGEKGEVSSIIVPKLFLQSEPRNLNRVISLNHRLLGPFMFQGEDISIEIGLFSILYSDLLGPYLNLLHDLSGAIDVGFLQSGVKILPVLSKGMEFLSEFQPNSTLEVGLSRTFQPVQEGLYLVIGASSEEIDVRELSVDSDNWLIKGRGGQIIKDYPYLLLEFKATREKHDWADDPELRRHYDIIKSSVIKGDIKEAKAALAIFKRVIQISGTLLPADSERLVSEIEKQVSAALGKPMSQSKKLSQLIGNLEDILLWPVSEV